MTAAEKRAKNRDRNKTNWNLFEYFHKQEQKEPNGLIKYIMRKPLFNTWVNKHERNENKRLITYLNRTARAEHMKRHGKTPKPVKTIREMYLEVKQERKRRKR